MLKIIGTKLKIFSSIVFISMLLVSCAATTFNHARSNANLVKDGMTVQQAVSLIGMPPTHETATTLEWRSGHAQSYDATPDGAISFQVKDGVIVGVPEGGIFGSEARRRFVAAWAEKRDQEAANQRDQQRQAAEAEAEAARKRSALLTEQDKKLRAEAADEEAKARAEIAAEMQAAANARIACNVKSTCLKVFALAQIYIATETDQKIQVVTDSVIQTYNPTDIGHVGASIIKMPGRGDSAEVTLTLSCKTGDYREGQSLCRIKNTRLYQGFKPFIERQLVQ
jgi:hypothetical protein